MPSQEPSTRRRDQALSWTPRWSGLPLLGPWACSPGRATLRPT